MGYNVKCFSYTKFIVNEIESYNIGLYKFPPRNRRVNQTQIKY